VVQRPGAPGAAAVGRPEKRRAVPYRAGPVVSRHTTLHQRLVEERWKGLFRGEQTGAVRRRAANGHSPSHLIPRSLLAAGPVGALPFVEIAALQLVMHGRRSAFIGR